jgi:hypothetical protein
MAFRGRLTTIGLLGTMLLAGCAGGANAGGVVPSFGEPLAKSAQADLFIADDARNVLIYTANITQSNPPLLGEITKGVSRSTGVYVDSNGTLYVLSDGGSATEITEYKRGSSAPFVTISKGLAYHNPQSLAVDSSGNLYVAENILYSITHKEARIPVYAPGATSPARFIIFPIQSNFRATNMAFDPKEDLLVDTFDQESNAATVYSIAPGSSKATKLKLKGALGLSLGADSAGNIYVGDSDGRIAIYPSGGTFPSRTISLNVAGFDSQMAVTPNGTIYWPNSANESMYEIAPNASAATNVFSTAASGVDAAVGPW